MSKPITEDELRYIKNRIAIDGFDTAWIISGRCKAVVAKIAASSSIEEYKGIVRAEHPPVKNSLGDRVAELERKVDLLMDAHERKMTEEVNSLFNTKPGVV